MVTFGARFGPTYNEAPLGPLGPGGPDLLAGDYPLAIDQFGLGLDIGQVGARIGLGIALAPHLFGGDDARQEAFLLLVVTEGDDGGTGQPFADMSEPARPARPRVFLEEYHLLHERQTAATVFDLPADAGPTGGGHVAFPGPALVDESALVTGAATSLERFVVTAKVVGHPLGDLLAKLLVLFAKA